MTAHMSRKGTKVVVFLDKFRYEGEVLDEDETFLILQDRRAGRTLLAKSRITTMHEDRP